MRHKNLKAWVRMRSDEENAQRQEKWALGQLQAFAGQARMRCCRQLLMYAPAHALNVTAFTRTRTTYSRLGQSRLNLAFNGTSTTQNTAATIVSRLSSSSFTVWDIS